MRGLSDPKWMCDNPNYDRGMFQLSELERKSINIKELSSSACETFGHYELAALIVMYGLKSVLKVYRDYKND